MRKTTAVAVAAIAGLGVTGAAFAQGTVIDLSGREVDGASPTEFTINQDSSQPLQAINFDIAVETLEPSWGSEVNITLTHESGFSFNADGSDDDFSDDGPADFLFGWPDETGVFEFSGSVPFDPGTLDDTSGEWTITLSDDFDDSGIDHVYLDGSTVTIKKIPAPGSLALLGLGGLAAVRRRR